MSTDGIYGRDPELDAIDGALDAVARGGMRLLTVRGEAGIGKTRLLEELRRRAGNQGFVVLDGRAGELERDVPLVPIVDALEPHLPEPSDVAAMESESVRLLAGLFPALQSAPGDPHSGAERWRLYRALADLLAVIGSAGPVLLVVDDVHWADPATAEFLDHLLRRPPSESLLVALGARPGETTERILVAHRASGGFGRVSLELEPLDRVAAEGMLEAVRGESERERILAESAGNPLLLEELANAGSESVPGGIVTTVRAQVDALGPDARNLLEAAAVAGDPWDLDLATGMAGLGADQAHDALDLLEERALVRPTDEPRRFAFRHPIVRRAVYDGLRSGALLATHAAAARELDRHGAPPVLQAPHLARAATVGDSAAAASLLAAAMDLRARAPSAAAEWLLAARRADPAVAEPALVAETLIEAGRLEEALVVIDSPESGGGSRLAIAGAGVERTLGRHDAAHRRLLAALNSGEEGEPASRIAADLAAGAYLRGDYAETLQWAEQAASSTAGGRVAEAAAATLLAVGQRSAGRADTGEREIANAERAIALASTEELAGGAELATAVSWGLLALDRLAEGLAVAQRIANASRERGGGAAAVPHDLAAALALGLLGRIPEAEAVVDGAEQAARMSGNPQLTQWALWLHAWILHEGGELDTALAAASESVELAADLDDSASRIVARAVLGAVLGARGEHERARELIAAYEIDGGWICRWSPTLVESDLALGDGSAAREHAGRATELAPRTGMPGAEAAAGRAAALVALVADSDPEQAAALARAAAERAEAAGAQLELARIRLLLGRSMLATDEAAAVAELIAASELAASCGGRRVEAAAERELRAAGVRRGRGGARAAGEEGLDALSPRELEVAHLVAEGLTNREIGARLFLSEKTIETHLTHIFQKLDLRARTQLAALVGDRMTGNQGP